MNYDAALKALEDKADLADNLGDRVDDLSSILAAIARRLRPDLTLLYADQDTVMIANLLAQYGVDGLIEELVAHELNELFG